MSKAKTLRKSIWDRDPFTDEGYDPCHPWHYMAKGDYHDPYPVDEIPPRPDGLRVMLGTPPEKLEKRLAWATARLTRNRKALTEAIRHYTQIVTTGREAYLADNPPLNEFSEPDLEWGTAVQSGTLNIHNLRGAIAGLEQLITECETIMAKTETKAAKAGKKTTTKDAKDTKSETPSAKAAKAKKPSLVPVAQLDILNGRIDPSPFQPRRTFDAKEMGDLAWSIKRDGLLQPICVRVVSEDIDGPIYELLDGERRWRACRLAGLKTIRAEVREATDAQARSIVLVSALQRTDLNPIEQAIGMQAILEAGDVKSVGALAKQLGMSQSAASNKMRLLELSPRWQQKIISREMTERHGREVLSIQCWAGPGRENVCDADAWDWFVRNPECTVDDFATAIKAILSRRSQREPRSEADEELLGDIQSIFDTEEINLTPQQMSICRQALWGDDPLDDKRRAALRLIVKKWGHLVPQEVAGLDHHTRDDCDEDCATCNHFGACEKPQRNADDREAAKSAKKKNSKPRIGDDKAAAEDLDEEISLLKFQRDKEKIRKHVYKVAESYPEEYKYRDELVDMLRQMAKDLKLAKI